MAQPQQKGGLVLDDEFEDFDSEDWDARAEDPKNAALWSGTWDDDAMDDAFAQQLQAQLAGQAAGGQQQQQQQRQQG